MKTFLCIIMLCTSSICLAEETRIKITETEVKEFEDKQLETIVSIKDTKQWLENHKSDFIAGIYPHYNDKKEFDGYIIYWHKKNDKPVKTTVKEIVVE